MKLKKTFAFLAALTFAVTAFAGCGDSGKDDEEEEKPKTTAAAKEDEDDKDEDKEVKDDEESKEEESSAEDTASEEESKADETSTAEDSELDLTSELDEFDLGLGDDSYDLSGMFGSVPMPSTEAVSAGQTEFVGKWECYCMASEGTAYDSMLGMPLYAMFHFEIKADGTGEISSSDFGEEAEVEEFTWTEDGKGIIVDSEGEKLTGVITADGYLLFTSDSGDDAQLFMKKVSDWTPFDMDAFTESLAASFSVEE